MVSLAVDGAERTLIGVEDVPETGAVVGEGRGGSGVRVGIEVWVGGKVEVMINSVGVTAPISCT